MKQIAAAALVVALSLAATTARARITAPGQGSLAAAAAVRAKAALGKPASPALAPSAGMQAAATALVDALPRVPKPTH
jgi:hypothetical protein